MIEMRRKQAESRRAMALASAAAAPVARNQRLNDRKKDMVSEDDVNKAKAELAAASAGVDIVDAEVAEVKLRIKQLRERQERLKGVIAVAERVKKDGPQQAAATPAGPNRP
jgi:hypothetical protein